MAVRTQPTLSPGLSARIAEAVALSPSSFRKRYRSSYETPSSSSSLTLLVRKRYRGTSELILDIDSEGDELGEEDIEEDESLDVGDEREGGGCTQGSAAGSSVVDTAVSEPLGLGYGAARRRALESIEEIEPSTYELGQSSRSVPEQEGVERISAFRQPTLVTWVDLEDDRVYTDIPAYAPPAAPVQTPPSPEWSLGSLPVSPSSPLVPSPIASPVATSAATILIDKDQFIEVRAQLELHGSILHDHTQRLDALPPTLVADIDRDVREVYIRSGAVRDEIFRRVLALEAWVGHVDTRMADISRDRYDDHRLIHDMLVQQAAMQRELQEMRGHVTTLEQERDRREVATLRALVHDGDKTSEDARTWYMISGDAKSWVCDCSTYIHSFEKHLEEIHLTWAQLEKKLDEDATLQVLVKLGFTACGDDVANPSDAVNVSRRR
ncbi:hypothetical protein Tco_0533448 [Tanacetum coccineum]